MLVVSAGWRSPTKHAASLRQLQDAAASNAASSGPSCNITSPNQFPKHALVTEPPFLRPTQGESHESDHQQMKGACLLNFERDVPVARTRRTASQLPEQPRSSPAASAALPHTLLLRSTLRRALPTSQLLVAVVASLASAHPTGPSARCVHLARVLTRSERVAVAQRSRPPRRLRCGGEASACAGRVRQLT